MAIKGQQTETPPQASAASDGWQNPGGSPGYGGNTPPHPPQSQSSHQQGQSGSQNTWTAEDVGVSVGRGTLSQGESGGSTRIPGQEAASHPVDSGQDGRMRDNIDAGQATSLGSEALVRTLLKCLYYNQR